MTNDPKITPPAPVGLVDAAKAKYEKARTDWLESPSRANWIALDAANTDLDATLSGQTGGAGPAGDLPSVEAFAEALYDTEPEIERSGGRWADLFGSSDAVVSAVRTPYRARAATLRARLAEQPGGKGDK